MTTLSVILNPISRKTAHQYINDAADGMVMKIVERTRSLEQSAKFHAICEDVSKSGFKWMGKPRTAKQWKTLFVSGHTVATGGQADIIPGLEQEFVNIRESTAAMSIKRLSSLIEYCQAFCSEHGIRLNS